MYKVETLIINKQTCLKSIIRVTDVKIFVVCYRCLEMARDSAVGRERILVVPGSLALDTTSNQHVTGAQNDLNQQILEVSKLHRRSK